MTKTAKRKANQGLLLVNASDIDSVRNEGGPSQLQHPQVTEDDERSASVRPGAAKSASSLTTAFTGKRPARKDDGFAFFAFMMMSMQSGQDLPAPRVS